MDNILVCFVFQNLKEVKPLKNKENKGNGEFEANVCEPAMKNEA